MGRAMEWRGSQRRNATQGECGPSSGPLRCVGACGGALKQQDGRTGFGENKGSRGTTHLDDVEAEADDGDAEGGAALDAVWARREALREKI